jgi:hypothetical protein
VRASRSPAGWLVNQAVQIAITKYKEGNFVPPGGTRKDGPEGTRLSQEEFVTFMLGEGVSRSTASTLWHNVDVNR